MCHMVKLHSHTPNWSPTRDARTLSSGPVRPVQINGAKKRRDKKESRPAGQLQGQKKKAYKGTACKELEAPTPRSHCLVGNRAKVPFLDLPLYT